MSVVATERDSRDVDHGRGSRWVAVVLGTVVVGAYLVHVGFYWGQINDDAFITFRYSQFLELGRGPYYNVGEQVEGYTNFLLMLLIAGVIKMVGPDHVIIAARLVGVLGGLAAIGCTWALCRCWLMRMETFRPHAAALAWAAAGLVAVNCAYVLNSTTGLETTLFSALILCSLWLVQKGNNDQRWRGAGVAFALAALTRPEGAMLFGAALLGRLVAGEWRSRDGRRRLLIDSTIVLIVVAGHIAFRMSAYDGELLPNTYYAKGGLAWTRPAVNYALEFIASNQGIVIPALAVIVLLAGRTPLRRDVLPALFVVLASVLGVIATGPDWMVGHRLLVPHAPTWAALAICAIAAISERLRWRPPLAAWIASGCLVAFLSGWLHEKRVDYYRTLFADARGADDAHATMADWINEHSRPGATIGLMDIGVVGYRCIDRNILDVTGLTDRHIAKSAGAFLAKRFAPSYVFDRQPEYLVIVLAGPAGPLGPETARRLAPWTQIEGRLLRHPEFKRHYAHRRRVDPHASPLEQLAATLGAVRIFRHDHHELNYLLAVYAYR